MDLRGKTAVVTGSATGVGQGIAVSLAGYGANVVVTHNRAPASRTMEMIAEVNGRAVDIPLNVTSSEAVDKLFASAAEHFGGVDILVNNAAVQYNKWLLEYTEEQYDTIMDVNLMGYFRCIRAAIPYLKKSAHGRVINVSSIHAKRPSGFDPVYSMTKSAIQMLTYEAAIELAAYGITVNALTLGAVRIESKSGAPVFKPGKREFRKREMPYGNFLSGRWGVPPDAGYITAFLASEESRYITGSSIRSDGGIMLITV
ncbi:MAG: SDR family oxidoreductase [Oscillospiraceae bacterium]|nr:SDR family oxidoreductase [Oscillospiraceae bacterium]